MIYRDLVVAGLLAIAMVAGLGAARSAAAQTGALVSGQDDASGQEPNGLELIREQQLELKSTLDGGEAERLSKREVNRIRQEQATVFALIEGKATLDELSINQKVELENALERINAYIKGGRTGRDEQNVCWRERMSGTSRMTTRCGTEKERDQAREGARDFLNRPRACIPPGCG
ncbi:hypothetical protein [Lysobacter sp. A3-1-A15]|uniref:hypothetical protein n=1 Tax=Novilysobacter viscosus TaxID=3098602 RepID=UPI002ED8B660